MKGTTAPRPYRVHDNPMPLAGRYSPEALGARALQLGFSGRVCDLLLLWLRILETDEEYRIDQPISPRRHVYARRRQHRIMTAALEGTGPFPDMIPEDGGQGRASDDYWEEEEED